MIFCSNCFNDPEIKSIIDKGTLVGDCPICGSKAVHLYDTNENDSLVTMFESLITAYTPEGDLPSCFPKEEMHGISECMKKDWNIFANISDESIYEILKSVAPHLYYDYTELYNSKVGIVEKYDYPYLEQHSILRTSDWQDFVDDIKCKNRFHNNTINLKQLEAYCNTISYTINPGPERFYRGRIAHDSIGFKRSEMGAPPAFLATDGRANAVGISRLYLTDNKETTLHEIRASEYDYVTIGTFKLLEKIRIVDLSLIDKISPFGDEVDLVTLAINRENLHKINMEMGHPMRRNDSVLDYLPTQYICDFIMSIKDSNGEPIYDGIRYDSVMHNVGTNYTVFYPNKFKCTFAKTYEVDSLNYHYIDPKK